jgi:hypothetical protein
MATTAARTTTVASFDVELSADDNENRNNNVDNHGNNGKDIDDNNEGIPPLGIYTRAMGKLTQNAAGATAVYQIFQMLGPMIFTPQPSDEVDDDSSSFSAY